MHAPDHPFLQAIDRSGAVRANVRLRATAGGTEGFRETVESSQTVEYREEDGRELPVLGLVWQSAALATEPGQLIPASTTALPTIALPALWSSSSAFA